MYAHHPHGVHVFRQGRLLFPPFLVPPPQKRPDVALSLLFRHMQNFQKAPDEAFRSRIAFPHLPAAVQAANGVIRGIQPRALRQGSEPELPQAGKVGGEAESQRQPAASFGTFRIKPGGPVAQSFPAGNRSAPRSPASGGGRRQKLASFQHGPEGDIILLRGKKAHQGHRLGDNRLFRQQQAGLRKYGNTSCQQPGGGFLALPRGAREYAY